MGGGGVGLANVVAHVAGELARVVGRRRLDHQRAVLLRLGPMRQPIELADEYALVEPAVRNVARHTFGAARHLHPVLLDHRGVPWRVDNLRSHRKQDASDGLYRTVVVLGDAHIRARLALFEALQMKLTAVYVHSVAGHHVRVVLRCPGADHKIILGFKLKIKLARTHLLPNNGGRGCAVGMATHLDGLAQAGVELFGGFLLEVWRCCGVKQPKIN